MKSTTQFSTLFLLLIFSLTLGAQSTLFTSDFTANTGAVVLTGNADNSSGSSTLTISDWSQDAIVTAISGLTKINTNAGVAADGGFAQLTSGTAAMASANTVFINENHNAGATPRIRGFSFSFTVNDNCHLSSLIVLTGHASGAGTDQISSSNLVYKLSGGTLGTTLTGSSTENYGSTPAYHTVEFDLAGTTLGAGTYTFEIYQTASTGGSYASFNGITLNGYTQTPPPAIQAFTSSPQLIGPGESVTLSWNVTGSTAVSIDQGIGSVSSSGSLVLSPNDSTTYTLTALNNTVPATASTTVTMRQEVDVYLFGGQSNMQGLGKISELTEKQLTPPANVYYWNHNSGSFEPFIPGTTVTASVGEFGPELAFAHAVADPNRKSYIIKYASSGKPLDSAWSGSSYDDHTNTWKGDPPAPGRLTFYPGTSPTDPNQGTLYKNQMLPRFKAGLADIIASGYTPVIKKFLWMQGEQDSKMELSAGRNAANLKRLRDRLAEDLSLAAPTDLPMVFGQVLPYSPHAARFAYRDLIRIQQATADMDSGSPNAIPFSRMISTDNYTLKTDHVHYDTAGQLQLGADFAEAFTPKRPNILVILVDDMGTEDCSVNFNYDSAGNPVDRIDPTSVGLAAFATDNRHYRTPHMEALASKGMVFSRAYANQVCSPTRVTFITGQNSARHGTIQYIGGGGNLHNLKAPPNPGLKDSHRTLAEVMRDAGYRTIITGKGHLGNQFNAAANNYTLPATTEDDYYGFQVNVSASTNGQQGSCYSNHSRAFGLPTSGPPAAFVAEYQDKTYNQIDPLSYPLDHPQANEPVFITEALTRELNERIEDSVNAGKPFFAYLSHFAVHDPHQPDPRFTSNCPSLSGDVLDFATMVEGIDQSLGDVVAKLEELGVAEDTLILFLGDNGSDAKPRGSKNPVTLGMTNPLRGEKGMRYEGGLRVPMIVSWAKLNANNIHQKALTIPAGSRTHDIVAVQDLFPTILAAAQTPLPTTDDLGAPLTIDGHDLTPYLRQKTGTHRPQQLVNHSPSSSRSSFFTTYIDGYWKLIYNYTTSSPVTSTNMPLGSYELYNLDEDIHESNNLADPNNNKFNSNKVTTMARAMARRLGELGAPYPILKANDPDLAALGLSASANDTHPVILPAFTGVDSDADTLDDFIEDANRNGKTDAGETDATNNNTDGDSTKDGDELKLGTDPLDATSRFKMLPSIRSASRLTLRWPSQQGLSFTIRSSPNLLDWTSVIASNYPADSGDFSSIDLDTTGLAKRFYRVELE